MATVWYYALNGQQKGPVTTEELKALVTSRLLSLDDLIWKKGLTEWVKVAQVRELAALYQQATSQAAQPTTQTPTQPHVSVKAAPLEELRLAPDPDEIAKKQQPPQEVAFQVANTPKVQAKPVPKPQAAQWYYARDGQQQGPVTAQFLKEKAQSGELLPTDQLWKDGLKDWVAAGLLPGLKFSVASGQTTLQPFQVAVQTVATAPVATDGPFATPDANSIFDIMNDPGFAAAPASSSEKPNAGLAAMPSYNEKPRRRAKIEFEDGSFDGLGYLLAAFLVPIPLAFIMAYFYGILRCYVGLYIVWYLCILGIGVALSMTACSLFEKARFHNQLVVLGYLLFLGMVVLYTAWASTITWGVNNFADEELERQIFLVEVMIRPQMVFEVAVEVSKEMESTGKGGRTSSAIPFLILEAVFMAAAPIYAAYRRYKNDS